MKKILAIIFIATFCSCSRTPFVEHKIDLEKKSEDCSGISTAFKMESNFGGERFEFEKCLPIDYSKQKIVSERKGDTVVVKFTEIASASKATYRCTLDIDSYPAYHFITIDDDTYVIGASAK